MYSDYQRFIAANIAALVLFDTPIIEGNRTYVASIKFDLPLEGTGSQVIKGIRLLDWQIEDLVKNIGVSSDIELADLLNPNRYEESSVELVLHTRTVGNSYTNPRTNTDFVVKPTDKIGNGEVVYSIELSDSNPLLLSSEVKASLREDSANSRRILQEQRLSLAANSFASRRENRLAELAKRNAMKGATSGSESDSGSDNTQDPVLLLGLEKLLAVATPTVKQKNRIAELQELLATE